MNIIDRIKLQEFRVSKSDLILMNYINENPGECVDKSISELASIVSIGEATITRFSRKLGFSGYQELKRNIAKYMFKENEVNRINSKVDLRESVHETAEKIFSDNMKAIEESIKILDEEKILKIREMILNANKIFFFGVGDSGIVATQTGYKFMRIGFDIASSTDAHTMVMLASLMKRGDLVFIFSHSGETSEVVKVCNIAQNNKAKVISITENTNNTLEKISDVNIAYVSKETVFETSTVLSKFTQLFLVELIYAEVIKENYDEFIQNKEKTTKALKYIRE
ncbi:MurR/RpiR family transcriptional regulator [Clostridium thermobutyricum]|uniref:MurR/RpiR family transcriptional regulator n=1 Tax=Clostridium thermobutyricum TaxID=29372 RepID=UPI003F51B873